jgi:CubicO group peptidase (beta-lactamase class C family)
MKNGFRGRALAIGALSAMLLGGGAVAQSLPKATGPEAVGFSSERLKRLDRAMADIVARGEVKGMATMLIRHGKIVAVEAYGNRDDANAMTRDTIFRLASMSKPVTGVALMMLFEEGKFRLDDPISKFVPEFGDLHVAVGINPDGTPKLEPVKHAPTMRNLMSHTAGLGYGMFQNTPGDRIFAQKAPLAAENLRQMIERMAQVPLQYQPGEHFSYSSGIDVEGYIVEKLSGMKFSEFLQQRLFGPLRMVDSGFFVPSAKIGRLAAQYRSGADGALLPAEGGGFGGKRDPSQPPGLESGGGGLFSTLDDYSHFAEMLANKGEWNGARILAPATVELMSTNSFPKPLPPDFALSLQWMFSDAMGFGLNMQTAVDPRAAGRLEGPGTLSWDGATGVWWWMDPANDVIFMGMIQNGSRAGPRGYQDLARQLVYQALVDPRK